MKEGAGWMKGNEQEEGSVEGGLNLAYERVKSERERETRQPIKGFDKYLTHHHSCL